MAGGSLTNKGTLVVPGDCTITNHATITNNEGAVINLSGVIDNQTDPVGTVANNGTIFLIRTGRVLGEDRLTGKSPVSVGTVPIPAGEIVIDMSKVRNTVTIGPESYTIDGTSHTYDPAQNNIVLTGTYGGNISGTSTNPAAAVTVLENTTASIILRDVNISWNDKGALVFLYLGQRLLYRHRLFRGNQYLETQICRHRYQNGGTLQPYGGGSGNAEFRFNQPLWC